VSLLTLLVACGAPEKPGAAAETTADTGTDTADAPPLRPTCPADMVLVGDGAEAWCIDTWEATRLASGGTASLPDVVPTYPITFSEALAACEATPVLDATGATRGFKRMARTQEWTDSADGTIGPGGLPYPYGELFEDGACATMDASGRQTIPSAVPTGSYPRCVSPWGAYDMIGNLWEWADSGLRIDLAGTLASFSANGTTLSADPDDTLRLTGGTLDGVGLLIIGLNRGGGLRADADGTIRIDGALIQTDPRNWWASGYLIPRAADPERATSFLPVRFAPVDSADPRGEWRALLRSDDDGAPIPDKRGCAYYTCEGDAATTTQLSRTHNHDFRGTIGFRCAADPFLTP
jgi:hypothetical protein